MNGFISKDLLCSINLFTFMAILSSCSFIITLGSWTVLLHCCFGSLSYRIFMWIFNVLVHFNNKVYKIWNITILRPIFSKNQNANKVVIQFMKWSVILPGRTYLTGNFSTRNTPQTSMLSFSIALTQAQKLRRGDSERLRETSYWQCRC